MNMQRREFLLASTAMGALAVAAGAPALAQPQQRLSPASNAASAGEWKSYGGDLGSNRYAALDQINKDNFTRLEVAWRFKTDSFGARPEVNFEGTPLMAGGVVYSTVGSRRDVVALDAGTGELLWTHREDEGPRGAAAPRRLSGRGLAFWTDGTDTRILYVTPGYRLVPLDARTGNHVARFLTNRVVELKVHDS